MVEFECPRFHKEDDYIRYNRLKSLFMSVFLRNPYKNVNNSGNSPLTPCPIRWYLRPNLSKLRVVENKERSIEPWRRSFVKKYMIIKFGKLS